MRTTKLLPASIAAFALVLGLAACGGSSSPSSEKATTTKAESSGSDDEATTTEADSGDDSDDDATTTVVATGGGDFCEDLATYINESSSTDIDPTDPEAYKQLIEESSEKGRELLSNAPGELSDSVEVLLDAQDQLADELEKVDYDVTKISPDALNIMSTPEIEEAGEKLDAYVTDTCGIDIPQVTAATVPDMTVPEITTPN